MFGFTPFAAAPFADLGSTVQDNIIVFPLGVEGVGQVGDVSITGIANLYVDGE